METVTISKTEYDRLIEDQLILQALYAGGVDNWDGYNDAVGGEEEDDEEDEDS
jgi:hypothetical protein